MRSGSGAPDAGEWYSSLSPDWGTVLRNDWRESRLPEDADSKTMSKSEIQKSEFQSGYLNAQQAAEYLGVSERLVRREVSEGRLAAFKPLAGVVRFHREDLDAWMRQGRIEATQPALGEQIVQMAPIRARRRSRPRSG